MYKVSQKDRQTTPIILFSDFYCWLGIGIFPIEPSGICMFKTNDKNTKFMCRMCATHFRPMYQFYTPWKQKNQKFSDTWCRCCWSHLIESRYWICLNWACSGAFTPSENTRNPLFFKGFLMFSGGVKAPKQLQLRQIQ